MPGGPTPGSPADRIFGMHKRGYHHGNLRQALVGATLKLLQERGPQGFTMAEAAKAAGVSPAAPYRHFSGKEDIIAECARQGFEIFADLMQFAYRKGAPSALASFEATGRAYLAFARKHPGHYIAMFESGLRINSDPSLAQASNRAMSVLSKATEELMAHLPPDRRPPPTMVTQHIWAMSHGVVELFARGEPGARAPFSPEDLLESGIGVYLRGLGILSEDDKNA